MGNENNPSSWFQTPEQTAKTLKNEQPSEDIEEGGVDPKSTTRAVNIDQSLRGPKVAQQNLQQFRDEGVSEDTIDNYRLFPDHQDLRKLRAQQQGVFETTAKDAVKTVPKLLGTTVEQFGYLTDIPAMVESIKALGDKAGIVDASDAEFGGQDNAISQVARNWNKAWEDSLPTYREDPGRVWAPSDPAWWTKNISGLIETVGAFGLTSKGLGSLAKGTTGLIAKGLSKGKNVSSTLGGAKTFRTAQRAAQGITTAGVSYAEGMMVGMEEYKNVKKRVKKKLQQSEEDYSQEEIERISDQRAGQAAATTAGINSLLLPALNWMSVSPLFRSSRSVASLANPKLAAQGGEQAFKKADDYLSRIKDLSGAAGMGQTGKEFLREGVLESVEEVSAQVAGGEGRASAFQEVGIDTEETGQRIVDNIFNSQTALESTLGFFGGVGQFGLMRSIPSQEAPDSFKPDEQGSAVRSAAEAVGAGSLFEDQISQSELERLREQEGAAKDKEVLKERVSEFIQAQEDLQDAKTEEEARKATAKLFRVAQSHEISRGVEQQLIGFMEDVANMDENEANELGFETDQDSDFYYKKRAREKIEEIEKYTELFKDLNSQYNFGAQEEFAGVPRAMLSLHMKRDYADQRLKDTQDIIDDIRREKKDQLDDQERSIYDELERQERIDDYEERNNLVDEIISTVENLDSQDKQNLSLLEITRGRGRNTENVDRLNELLAQLNKSELREVRDAFRGINAQRAEEILKEFVSRRKTEVEQLRTESPEGGAYAQFLEENQLKNTEEARAIYKSLTDRVSKQYNREISKKEEQKQEAKLQKESAQSELNRLEEAQNRQELVERTKEIFEENRNEISDKMQSRLNTADTVEEVEQIKEAVDDRIVENIGEDIFDERKEEIRDEKSQEPVEGDVEEETTQEESESQEEPQGDPTVFQEEKEAEEGEATDISFEDIVGESNQTEDANVTVDEAEEATRNWMVNNVDFSKDPSDINVEQKEEDLESFIDNNFEDLNESDIEDLKSQFLGEEGEFRKRVNSSTFSKTPIDNFNVVEVVGVVNAPSTMEKLQYYRDMADEETARSGSRNAFTGVSLGYKSKDYQNVVQRGENVLINKRNTRSDDLDNELVEHPEEFQEGDEIAFIPEDVDENAPESAADSEKRRIAIYRNGTKSGYLWHPYNIDETNTTEGEESQQSNVADQQVYNRQLRNTVMDMHNRNGGNPVAGEVSKPPGGKFAKSPGNLSIRYKTDQDGTIKIENEYPVRDYRPASENLPQTNLPLYVMRGNSLHTNDGKGYDVINNEEFFEGNEGSVGAIVTMANGKHLAVPLWSPTLEEADQVDTVTNLIMEASKDQKQSFENVDLNDPAQFETQVENYIHTNSHSPSQIFNVFNNEELVGREVPIFVVSNKTGHVTLGIPGSGAVFTSIEEFHSEPGYQPIKGNEEAVRDIVKKARFDVDAQRLNDYDQQTGGVIPGSQSGVAVVTTNDNGELTVENVDTYNQHVKKNLYTDIDGRHTVNGNHIYAEQPVITLSVTTGKPDVEQYQSTPKPNPNDTSTSDTSGDQTSDQNEDVEGDNTEGDSQDIESAANTEVDTEEFQTLSDDEITDRLRDNINSRAVDNLVDFFDNIQDILTTTRAELEDNVDQVGSARSNMIMDVVEDINDEIEAQEGSTIDSVKENAFNILETQIENSTVGISSSGVSNPAATYIRSDNVKFKVNNQLSNILKNNDINVEEFLREFSDKVNVNYNIASKFLDFNFTVEVEGKDGKIEITTQEDTQEDANTVLRSVASELNNTNIETTDNKQELNRLLDEAERAESVEFDDTEQNIQYYNDIQSAKTDIREKFSDLGFQLDDTSEQQTENPQSDEDYDVPEWGDDFDDEFIGNDAFDTVTMDKVESVDSGVTQAETTNEEVLEAFQDEENAQITCKTV